MTSSFSGLEFSFCKPYDGIDLPHSVVTLIKKHQGNVLFGGSSLIHDIYFKDEDWGKRDHDMWCLEDAYNSILQTLLKTKGVKQIATNDFEKNKYYGRFKIFAISDFLYKEKGKKIFLQLINIGRPSDKFYKVLTNIDLSFNSVFYNGENIYFFHTTEEDVKNKTGNYITNPKLHTFCNCSKCHGHIEHKLLRKEQERYDKYLSRKFTINNICPFCREKNISTLNHTINCLRRKMTKNKEKNINFFQSFDELSEEQLLAITNSMEQYQNNPGLLLGCLLVILFNRNLELFYDMHDKFKSKINYKMNFFYEFLYMIVMNGLLTGFKLFFPLVPHEKLFEKGVTELFLLACKKNYINIGRYFNSLSNRFRLEIFEDKIFSYKFLSIYEFYLENQNIELLTKELKYLQLYEATDEEDICPICKISPSNLILNCKHKYCDICLMSYFSQEENKKHSLICPTCRTEIYNQKSVEYIA